MLIFEKKFWLIGRYAERKPYVQSIELNSDLKKVIDQLMEMVLVRKRCKAATKGGNLRFIAVYTRKNPLEAAKRGNLVRLHDLKSLIDSDGDLFVTVDLSEELKCKSQKQEEYLKQIKRKKAHHLKSLDDGLSGNKPEEALSDFRKKILENSEKILSSHLAMGEVKQIKSFCESLIIKNEHSCTKTEGLESLLCASLNVQDWISALNFTSLQNNRELWGKFKETLEKAANLSSGLDLSFKSIESLKADLECGKKSVENHKASSTELPHKRKSDLLRSYGQLGKRAKSITCFLSEKEQLISDWKEFNVALKGKITPMTKNIN